MKKGTEYRHFIKTGFYVELEKNKNDEFNISNTCLDCIIFSDKLMVNATYFT
jgi:hypothetical protein